jgi:hypothetical protein
MEFMNPPVYRSLSLWQRLRASNRTYSTVHLTPLAGHSLALPLAFRLGHLDPRPMSQRTVISQAYEAAKHHHFLEVDQVDPSQLSEEQLIQLATGVHVHVPLFNHMKQRSGVLHTLPLPALTSINIPTQEPPYNFWAAGGSPAPEYEQHDESYYHRVVVIGEPTSVPDLCLAWNLRAQRTDGWPFPMWIAPRWLGRPEVVQNLQLAVSLRQGGMLEDRRPPVLRLVSTSLSPAELEVTAAGLPWSVVAYDGASLDRFFTAGFKVGQSAESIVSFRDGVANVPLPDYPQLADFEWFDSVAWSLSIDRYILPHYPRGSLFRRGVAARVASDGLAGWANVDQPPGALITIGTDSAWEIVDQVARQAGYEAQLSDKGKLASAIMDLLPGDGGLDVLASSLVYRLLYDMAEIEPRQEVQRSLRRIFGRDPSPEQLQEVLRAVQGSQLGEVQFDRKHRPWDELRNTLGASSEAIVRWLVAKRILFRGYDIKCPSCGLRRWHPMDQLSETHHCEGCQVDSPIPIGPDRLQWRYRLNEVMARAVDQGVLPHLLATRRMSVWAKGLDPDLLGFLPGVVFRPLSGGEPGEIEVDLLAIKAGRIIVGECKEQGGTLQRPEVDRFAALGRLLACSRIIYATPTTFADAAETIEHARATSSPAHVEVWQAEELLDVSVALGLEARRPTPSDYLAAMVLRLS